MLALPGHNRPRRTDHIVSVDPAYSCKTGISVNPWICVIGPWDWDSETIPNCSVKRKYKNKNMPEDLFWCLFWYMWRVCCHRESWTQILLCCSTTSFHGLENVPRATADDSRTHGSKQCTNTHPHPSYNAQPSWLQQLVRSRNVQFFHLIEVGLHIHHKSTTLGFVWNAGTPSSPTTLSRLCATFTPPKQTAPRGKIKSSVIQSNLMR